MQLPPSGAQIPQLSLQQNSSGPQYEAPHGSPGFSSGEQNSRVQPSPNGTQRLQLSLQQYSPGPQTASLHDSPEQSTSAQSTSPGTQMPPHCGQHVVPSRQSIAAHGFSSIGTQIPEQSAPPASGSQSSPALSTQVYPSGQGNPAMPPHIPPGVPTCANTCCLVDMSAAALAAITPSAPRRDRRPASAFVHRSNRSLSIAPPSSDEIALPILMNAGTPVAVTIDVHIALRRIR
jgi:hypothetical protein